VFLPSGWLDYRLLMYLRRRCLHLGDVSIGDVSIRSQRVSTNDSLSTFVNVESAHDLSRRPCSPIASEGGGGYMAAKSVLNKGLS